MVIDFHTHVFPDGLAPRVIPMLAERAGLTPSMDGTVGGLLASMREGGVDHAVALSIATNARQNKNVNDFALSINNTRLTAFGSVHPEADWRYELDRLADGGIRGVKLHPDYQGFFVDDPAMQPIYEAVLRKGMILLFHAGLDYGLPEPIHATPERLRNVLGLFRGERVVLAHMGGFNQWDGVAQLLIGEDVYLDTSCAAFYMEQTQLAALLEAHRPDRLLFATDCPWGFQAKETAFFRQLPISETLRSKLMGENACQLLGLADGQNIAGQNKAEGDDSK